MKHRQKRYFIFTQYLIFLKKKEANRQYASGVLANEFFKENTNIARARDEGHLFKNPRVQHFFDRSPAKSVCFSPPSIRKVKICRFPSGRGFDHARNSPGVSTSETTSAQPGTGTCLQCSVIYSHGRSLRVIYIYRQNSRRQFGICIQPRLFRLSRHGSILFNVRTSICRIRRAKNVRYVLRYVINNANAPTYRWCARPLICRDADSSFSIMSLVQTG